MSPEILFIIVPLNITTTQTNPRFVGIREDARGDERRPDINGAIALIAQWEAKDEERMPAGVA